ncbi:MAG: hypothetical protein PSN44_08660 [Gammaproteobacteria bacterium]|nr:hypothetical protein [Gammaproteobacteria bacterium]
MKKLVFNHPAIIDSSGDLSAKLIIARVKEMNTFDLNILIQLLPNASMAKHRVQNEIYIKSTSPAVSSVFKSLTESSDSAFSKGTIAIDLDDYNDFSSGNDDDNLVH